MTPALDQERWLAVVGFEGHYEVSDHGRVRSLDRVLTYAQRRGARTYIVERRHRGRLLKPGTVESGHQLVVLGVGNSRLVHALVLTAFVGPKPPGREGLHGDGIPANNRLRNLRWGTRSENMQDALRHGAHGHGPIGKGEACPRAILTNAQVLAIRADLGIRSHREIAADYGVSRSTIGKISSGRNWSHLQAEGACA